MFLHFYSVCPMQWIFFRFFINVWTASPNLLQLSFPDLCVDKTGTQRMDLLMAMGVSEQLSLSGTKSEEGDCSPYGTASPSGHIIQAELCQHLQRLGVVHQGMKAICCLTLKQHIWSWGGICLWRVMDWQWREMVEWGDIDYTRFRLDWWPPASEGTSHQQVDW